MVQPKIHLFHLFKNLYSSFSACYKKCNLDLSIAIFPNSTSQIKKTVQIVLILFFFSLWVMSCSLWSRSEIPPHEDPSSPPAPAGMPSASMTLPCSQTHWFPKSFLLIFQSPLPHQVAFPVSAPARPPASPTVQPHGPARPPKPSGCSSFLPLLMLFLPLLSVKIKSVLCYPTPTSLPPRTFWFPNGKESSPSLGSCPI